MPSYQCVVRCFWDGVFYSPQPDGRQYYEGDKQPPRSKNGLEYFKRLDDPKSEEIVDKDEKKGDKPWQPTVSVMEKWKLQQLNKAELLAKMRKDFKIDVDETTTTRKELIDKVLELQLKCTTNQDIANQVKA